MAHTHGKGHGQKSFGSKVRVATDRQMGGWTEAIAIPTDVLTVTVGLFSLVFIVTILLNKFIIKTK